MIAINYFLLLKYLYLKIVTKEKVNLKYAVN